MGIDERINEFVRLYTAAIGAAPRVGTDALTIADGMERAAIQASGGEAAMVQAMTMERLAFARMQALGIQTS